MADIKFHCPECEQRLAVDERAIGMAIDCPECHISLVIPPTASAPVQILARREVAAATRPMTSAYEELERKQRELSDALEEAARLRSETERSKSELARVREDLATAANRLATPPVASETERLRRENETLATQLAEAEAGRELLAQRVEKLSAAPPPPVARPVPAASEFAQPSDELRQELARTTETLAAITAERDALREQSHRTSAIESELVETRTRIEQREAELREVRNAMKLVSAERTAAHHQLGEHATALQDLSQLHAAAREQADTLGAQLAAVVADLDARGAAHDEAARALAERDASLHAVALTVDAAKNEIDRLKEEAATADYEQAQLARQLAEISDDARDLQHRVDTLLDDLHAREREVAETREQLGQTAAARADLQQKLAEKEDELREFAARLEATHRYAETKMLETQQDAEAKIETAQREADERVTSARSTVHELLAAKQELETKLAGLETNFSDSTSRFEALRQATESERAVAGGEREALVHRVEQLLSDVSARESELAETRRKLEDYIETHEIHGSELAGRTAELARVTAELDQLRSESTGQIAAAQQAAATAQREVDARLAAATGEAAAELARVTAEHEATIARLTKEHEVAAARLAATHETNVENAASDYEGRVKAAREEASQLTRVLSEDRDRLKEELAQSNKHADVLDARVASLQADLQRTHRSLEQIREELQTTRQQQKGAADEIVEKDKQVAELLVQLAAAEVAEKGVRTRAEEADRDFRAKLELAKQTEDEARRAITDRDRLAAELERSKGQLATAMETMREAQKDRDAVRLSVDAMQLQLEENLDQIHAREEERDGLKAELEGVRAGLERAKQHVTVLQSRRDQMRDELARLKLQLGQSPDSSA